MLNSYMLVDFINLTAIKLIWNKCNINIQLGIITRMNMKIIKFQNITLNKNKGQRDMNKFLKAFNIS